jgi:hypothetical protein
MASLHPPRAHPATAHRNVETAHHGPPHDVFLILRLAAFRLHATAAVRATLRQRDRDLFIDTRRDRAARLPTVAPTRLAAWPPRVGFWFSAGVRRRLPLAGAQGRFQCPAQAFTLLFQPVILFPQPLDLLLRPI